MAQAEGFVMRVLFDHSVFSLQTRGGISRYFCELVRNLQGHQGCAPRILAPCHQSALLREMENLPVTGRYVPPLPHDHRLRQWVNNGLSTLAMRFIRPDLVHATYYLGRVRIPTGTPLVVTVFDMIHERFSQSMPPGEQSVARAKKKCVKRADHVICISEQTKRDLVNIIGVDERKITVISLGCSFPIDRGGDTGPLLKGPYFLYVGNRSEVKNSMRVVEAFARSRRLGREFRLVCFGGGAFTDEELRAAGELGISPRNLIQIGGDDAVLDNLYRHAVAFVYPSLYEGFGLPLLEAMSCGCPVICSDCSSLPEVAGQAALFFDPHSTDALRDCMERVADSVDLRKQLITAGRKRCRRFSWKRCAEETLQVYKKCLKTN